jgi:DNA replication protein DnaC
MTAMVARIHDRYQPTAGRTLARADAVLDRLVHTAHRIELKGESLRKLRAAKTTRLDEANPS